MGPLVPTIISNEFSLVVAIISGIGFGFALEQAGFSSTKKLVGLFYGYDFTVLKVFFTAGVTAMIGVLILANLGFLDTSLIYINPTFLWSALVGGAIMGLGFIIGGFCPGTSVCAAAIGKLDGLAFVFGSALGVWVFAEAYPVFEKLYLAEAWGPVLINEKLGMSKMAFAFLLTAIAVAAFYLTRLIENKVNGIDSILPRNKVLAYSSAVVVTFLILIVLAVTPNSKQRMEARINKEIIGKDFSSVQVPADKLANEIVNNYYKINIVDLRSPEAFKVYHLPFAINIPLEKLNEPQGLSILKQKHKTNYFYSDDKVQAEKAYLLAEYVGKADNFILKESAQNFREMYTDLDLPGANADKNAMNVYNFRKKAAADMASLVDALKNSNQPVVQKASRIKGGC